MNKADLEKYKKAIIEMRSKIMDELENSKNTESLRESAGEHSLTYHLADQGSDCNEEEKKFLLASLEGDILKKLDRALERIANNTYGICMMCGDEINPQRLDAIPYAELCLECQAREEQQR